MKPPENISPRNVGVDWTRAVNEKTSCDQINLEKIFMEEWNLENGDRFPGGKRGIAQLLMIIRNKETLMFDGPDQSNTGNVVHHPGEEVCIYNLTEREHRIIATIVQWLGTNVGFHFIGRCLKRAGYVVHEFEPFVPGKPKPPPPPVEKIGRFRILDLT